MVTAVDRAVGQPGGEIEEEDDSAGDDAVYSPFISDKSFNSTYGTPAPPEPQSGDRDRRTPASQQQPTSRGRELGPAGRDGGRGGVNSPQLPNKLPLMRT